jgi:CubicO group peptidase (beta-lactamase class C family)
MKRHIIPVIVLSLFCIGPLQAEVPEGFIRTWLLCGPFPNPPNKPKPENPDEPYVYDHTPPCVGLDTDHLTEHGGEAEIVPTEGMSHTGKDGAEVKWFSYTSNEDKVVFRKAITKLPNVVAYAFKTVEAKEGGRYLMSLGSDEGVAVWVNGARVHYNLLKRRINADDDLIPITFKKGENHILIKVEQGWGGWGFITYVMPADGVLKNVDADVGEMTVTASLRKRASDKPQKVSLVGNGKTYAEATFGSEAEDGLASVAIQLPFLSPGEEYGELDIMVEGEKCGTLEIPSLDRMRYDTFKWETPRGYPGCVFVGTELPKIDFERPLRIKELIGPYEISTRYYDADFNEVDSAEKPGRYGAVVDIKTASHTTSRFVPLFRQEKDFSWRHELEAEVKLPEGLGIEREVAKEYADHVNRFLGDQLAEGLRRDPGGAILLAALDEAGEDREKDGYYTNPGIRNRRWWLQLKRKRYGSDKAYPEPFVCPRKVEGEPARVIRKGSLREAGMKKDFPKKMDTLLKAWANDSDEAFAVLIARRGVIAIHKPYGTRHGKRMTLETKSWMASTTKLMSGTLIMMLVDQGLISLDDTAAKHLPPLKSVEKQWPATIRDLYMHTADMEGHWGSWMSDMEYRVADIASYCTVGEAYRYDGAGLDLTCKILELISGETLPDFFKNHLWDTLGCENTEVDDAAGGTQSVPLDMAKVAQMLLQKGKYGDMQFFTEDTFEQMLPVKVEAANPPWDGYYGIGTGFFKGDGLGEGTFGHGAASSAYVRIDPENDLVVIMTRDARGGNFGKYSGDFFRLIMESLEEGL